ncbi:MAG: hypothetical protein ACFB21_12925 [Opitutales bacterium]
MKKSRKASAIILVVMTVGVLGYVLARMVTTSTNESRSLARRIPNLQTQNAVEGVLQYAAGKIKAMYESDSSDAVATLESDGIGDIPDDLPDSLKTALANADIDVSSIKLGIEVNPESESIYLVPTTTNSNLLREKKVKVQRISLYASADSASTDDLAAFGSIEFLVQDTSFLEYAIFYENDLEFYSATTMTINGPVHSNSDIWVAASSSASLNFLEQVTSVGIIQAGLMKSGGTESDQMGDVVGASGVKWVDDPTVLPQSDEWDEHLEMFPAYVQEGVSEFVPTGVPRGGGNQAYSLIMPLLPNNHSYYNQETEEAKFAGKAGLIIEITGTYPDPDNRPHEDDIVDGKVNTDKVEYTPHTLSVQAYKPNRVDGNLQYNDDGSVSMSLVTLPTGIFGSVNSEMNAVVGDGKLHEYDNFRIYELNAGDPEYDALKARFDALGTDDFRDDFEDRDGNALGYAPITSWSAVPSDVDFLKYYEYRSSDGRIRVENKYRKYEWEEAETEYYWPRDIYYEYEVIIDTRDQGGSLEITELSTTKRSWHSPPDNVTYSEERNFGWYGWVPSEYSSTAPTRVNASSTQRDRWADMNAAERLIATPMDGDREWHWEQRGASNYYDASLGNGIKYTTGGLEEHRESLPDGGSLDIDMYYLDIARLKDAVENAPSGEWGANFDPANDWNGIVHVSFPLSNPDADGNGTIDPYEARADRIIPGAYKNLALGIINGSELPAPANPEQDPSISGDELMGFTLATNAPIYLIGDYNADGVVANDGSSSTTPETGETPALLAGDVVTIMSKGTPPSGPLIDWDYENANGDTMEDWPADNVSAYRAFFYDDDENLLVDNDTWQRSLDNDDNDAGSSSGDDRERGNGNTTRRTAVNVSAGSISRSNRPVEPDEGVEISAAVIAGSPVSVVGDLDEGSGGAHNFFRYREDWNYHPRENGGTGPVVTYRGSILALFKPEMFTTPLEYGDVETYTPPERNFGFNTLFDTYVPPGTPTGRTFRARGLTFMNKAAFDSKLASLTAGD